MNWHDLRIGLIGPLPPPAGGMANQTRQLKELLEREGAAVTLVQTNAAFRPAWIGAVPGLRAVFRLIPHLLALWRCAGCVDVLHIMANSGWSWHLHAAPAVWIGSARGARVVINYRGGEAATFLEKSAHWVLPTLSRADILAVPSGFLRDVFREYGVASQVLPNVVDVTRFRPEVSPPRRESATRIVVARNLEPIYDIATAIRAFAIVHRRISGAILTVAGSGPEHDALKSLACELGVAREVTFTGRLDRDQMAGIYRGADIVLNPSLVDNMPNSVLEALASGVPVVSTRVGGVPHIVQDGVTALLVPPGEPEAMAEALLRLVNDAALAAKLRRAGMKEAQKYTWAVVRDSLLTLYVGGIASSNDGVHRRSSTA